MGIDYNNVIVTDGLSVYLDTANPRCYSGSGITVNGLVGGIGGIVGKRAVNSAHNAFRPQPPMQGCGGGYGGGGYGMPNSSYASPQSAYGLPSQPFGAMPVWKNPELDESWTPGPPPTTPPEHMEPDEEREEIAAARKEAE